MNMNNHDYNIVNENSLPQFTENSPALALLIHSVRNRARAGILKIMYFLISYLIFNNFNKGTLYLPHGKVRTPVFMPVGTKGTIKALTSHQLLKGLYKKNYKLL